MKSMVRRAKITVVATATLLSAALLMGPELASAEPDAFVTAWGSNNVQQYNLGPDGALALKSPATVGTGANPSAIAVSPDGESAYAINQTDGNVSQYDIGADGQLTPKSPGTVTAGTTPVGVTVSPDGSSVYVANVGSSNVSQYDVDPGDGTLTAKTPATVSVPEAERIAISPDGLSAYVTDFNGPVFQFDIDPGDGTLSAKTPASVSSGSNAGGIAMSPDGASAYVTNAGADTVSQYDVDSDDGTLSAKTPATVSAGDVPVEIVVSPEGASAYVAASGPGSNAISQYDIDPSTGKLTAKSPATVGAGTSPQNVAISPDGKSAYAPNFSSADVSQYDVDPSTGKLSAKSTATVSGGSNPLGIALRPDTIGPTSSIDSGPSGTVSSPGASFTFSSNELGSTFKCSLDGALPFTSCTSPQGYTGLAEGAHSLSVQATDFSGNPGTIDTQGWTIDLTAPTTTINLGPAGGSTISDPTPTFGFSSEPGASFQCKVDSGSFAACSSPKTIGPLADGAHTFQVRARDAAGNTDTTPSSRSFTVDALHPPAPDTTAPDTAIDKAPKKKVKTRKKKAKVKFAFSSADPTASFECALDDEDFAACSPPFKAKVKKGKHSFQVRARDAAGNVDPSPGTYSWKVKRKKG
jgi:6-phosphogluconolactonase (cycloisomerase 2 family)